MNPIQEWFVTFGVQYREGGDKHDRGMDADGYAVIEAPEYDTAHAIASAIFGTQWAFLYSKANFIDDGTAAKWHPKGELFRSRWIRFTEDAS